MHMLTLCTTNTVGNDLHCVIWVFDCPHFELTCLPWLLAAASQLFQDRHHVALVAWGLPLVPCGRRTRSLFVLLYWPFHRGPGHYDVMHDRFVLIYRPLLHRRPIASAIDSVVIKRHMIPVFMNMIMWKHRQQPVLVSGGGLSQHVQVPARLSQ